MRIRSAKSIMRYLGEKHGIDICRDTLWTWSRAKGPRRFPLERGIVRFQLRVVADSSAIDDWVARNRTRRIDPTPSTPSDRGPELPPRL